MKRFSPRQLLLCALVLLGVGGALLHLRVHPIYVADGISGERHFRPSFIAASLLPLLDVFLVTFLFLRRQTAVYGYVLNGFIVIYGTVLMAHFSLADLVPRSAPFLDYFLKSTFPDILLAWADFLVGKLLYEAWLKEGTQQAPPP